MATIPDGWSLDDSGKALVRISIDEGPQYRVGRFDVNGNQRFSSEQVRGYFPFDGEGPTLSERVTDVLRRRRREEGVFDQSRWDAATAPRTGCPGRTTRRRRRTSWAWAASRRTASSPWPTPETARPASRCDW